MPDIVLTGGRLVLPRSIVEGGALVLREGKIAEVLEKGERLPADLPRRELGRAWVTPGLIEAHLRGCGGLAFDSLGTNGATSLARAAAYLRERGVTTFVPAIAALEAALGGLAAALDELRPPREDVPGIYLEGPFVNPAMRGDIPLAAISQPDSRLLGRLINLGRGRLALMTLAPELPGYREILARVESAGILPCLGHSGCNIDRITLPTGRFSISRLFNDMSPISHEEPGLAMLPFLDRRAFVELNPDGKCVNEAALRICAGSLEPERLILASAASGRLVGGPLPGTEPLGADLLRNWLRVTGSSVPNAVRMMTLTPAQALGIDGRRGAIAPGFDAALVVWEGEFEEAREVFG